MAVLKRGDIVDRLKLDASRKFAASFAMAWGVWIKHFGSFLRIMWQPCLLAVAVGIVWFMLRPSYGYICMAADIIAGAAVLFVWSMMRTMQLKVLADVEAGNAVESAKFVRNFVAIAKPTWRPYLPLLTGWLLAYMLAVVPAMCRANIYVCITCVAVAAVVPFSVGGIVQSYMEVKPVPMLGAMRDGLKLNRHYWGGMAALWMIFLLLFVIAGTVLTFGPIILGCVFSNSEAAMAQEEVIEVPSGLRWMLTGVFALQVWVLSFMQSIWSLPQQVHIRSIIYKTLNK